MFVGLGSDRFCQVEKREPAKYIHYLRHKFIRNWPLSAADTNSARRLGRAARPTPCPSSRRRTSTSLTRPNSHLTLPREGSQKQVRQVVEPALGPCVSANSSRARFEFIHSVDPNPGIRKLVCIKVKRLVWGRTPSDHSASRRSSQHYPRLPSAHQPRHVRRHQPHRSTRIRVRVCLCVWLVTCDITCRDAPRSVHASRFAGRRPDRKPSRRTFIAEPVPSVEIACRGPASRCYSFQ